MGMVMAGVGVWAGFAATFFKAGCCAAGFPLTAFFFAGFFAGTFLAGAGMFIPGMSIGWDKAGTATSAVLNRNRASFTGFAVSRD
jgi:hypothetical protein